MSDHEIDNEDQALGFLRGIRKTLDPDDPVCDLVDFLEGCADHSGIVEATIGLAALLDDDED